MGPTEFTALLGDLAAETEVVTAMLTGREPHSWELPTPAAGWAIRDQVSHLAFGVARPATSRLRHIAHLGVRTLGFSFQLNGLDVPEQPVRVELTGPDGTPWRWGPAGAEDQVTGPALDFCLQWMGIAQAFAGPPSPGRAARASA